MSVLFMYLSFVHTEGLIFFNKKKFFSSFLLNRTCNAGIFLNFVCTVLKLEKMKNNKTNNDYIAKYNL